MEDCGKEGSYEPKSVMWDFNEAGFLCKRVSKLLAEVNEKSAFFFFFFQKR